MKFLRFLLILAILLVVAVVVVNFIMDQRKEPPITQSTAPSDSVEASQSTEPPEPTVPSEPEAQILPMDQLLPLGSFHEGLLIAQRKSDDAVVCIDGTGLIRFTMEPGYLPHKLVNSRFYNGLTLVCPGGDTSRLHLCKTDGTIVRPEDFGGTEFVFGPLSLPAQQERFFADGYIMVTDGERMGLLDSDLNLVVPLSAEYRQTVLGFASGIEWEAEIYYGGGCFLSKNGYLNIETCEQGAISELESLPGSASDYWSALWGANTIMFLDGLGEGLVVALNLSDYVGPLMAGGASIPTPVFRDGLAPLLSIHADGNNFTLVDESGNLCFEPVEVFGDSCVYDSANGLYCLSGMDKAGDLVIRIFDRNGQKFSHRYPIPAEAEHTTATLEDGVILICNRFSEDRTYDVSWELFDLNFEPLYS